MNREETIERLLVNPKISVLIIGAGINGISAFRDLALQGVDVLLVDRGDYSSGASASSVYTLEENVPYPEKGAPRQMRDRAIERSWLLGNIPHLVRPLTTVIPTFRRFAGPLKPERKFPGWEQPPLDLGAKTLKKWVREYTRANRGMPQSAEHPFAGRKKSLAQFSKLNPLVHNTGSYTDAAMPRPERICIEMIQDALNASKRAYAANYVEMDRLEGNKMVLVDKLNDEQFSVEPSLVINATGPWVDDTNQTIGKSSEYVAGSKSVHLVLDHPELSEQLQGKAFRFPGQETPGVFIFPLENKVMIGASGLPLENRYHPQCTPDEINHFFKLVKLIFPEIPVERSQIVFQFSGVVSGLKEAHPGEVHPAPRIEKSPAGTVAAFPVLTLVGGRWTSFWRFAEQVADAVLTFFQIPRQVDTKSLPIGGSNGLPLEDKALTEYQSGLMEKYGAPAKLIQILVGRYGSRAETFLQLPNMVSPTSYWPFSGYTPEEIDLLAKEEDVIHLDDLILRRTMIGKLGMLEGDGLNTLAEIVAKAKGWSDEFKQEEIDRTVAIMRDRYRVMLRPE